MRFTSFVTSALLAASLISSSSAILTRYTRSHLPASRTKTLGTTSSLLRYRDIADVVDQVLVERGLLDAVEDSTVLGRELGLEDEVLYARNKAGGGHGHDGRARRHRKSRVEEA